MNEWSDEAAICEVLDGNSNAYAVLVERYKGPVFNLMYRMTGCYEDAVDLAQETFIKAYEQLYRFRRGERFFPWIYTIGLNHARNHLRRRRNTQTIPVEDCDLGSGLDYLDQQEERMCSRLDSQRILKALDLLPFDYREALILRYYEEVPVEEIAASLKLSESGVRMRISRGLRKLREIVMRDGHENQKQTRASSSR
jgi:RNA polymerase sigma-70 factor (ECF subfamily)